MRETAAPETAKGAGEECFGPSALARFGKRAACAPGFGCVRAREGRKRSRNVSWNQRLNKLRSYRGLRGFWTFWTPESSDFFDLEPSKPWLEVPGKGGPNRGPALITNDLNELAALSNSF